METFGVYSIGNRINNKFYVGCSINIELRIMSHFSALSSGKHTCLELQRDYDYMGVEAFYMSYEYTPNEKNRNKLTFYEKETMCKKLIDGHALYNKDKPYSAYGKRDIKRKNRFKLLDIPENIDVYWTAYKVGLLYRSFLDLVKGKPANYATCQKVADFYGIPKSSIVEV